MKNELVLVEVLEDKAEDERRRDEPARDYADEEIVELVRQHRRDQKALQAIADQAITEGKPVPTDLLERLLATPIKLARFTPLTREELYDRQGETR